jgi:hypothetical protein
MHGMHVDTINFLNPIQPFPDWFAVGENLKTWAAHNTIGYMAQGGTIYPPGTDLHELKTYVSARLLWNSTLDPLREMAEFLVLYYGEVGAAAVKLYMDTMIGSIDEVGFCRADDGRSLGFPPTAPFLTPEAVLTAANGFADVLGRRRQQQQEGEEQEAPWQHQEQLSAKHRFRLERAAMSINWVVLVRWDELRAFANRTGFPWPLLDDKNASFYEGFEQIGNETERVLGRSRDSLGAKPLSWYREQVFNTSARAWCLPYEGPHACDFDWVNDQPCCPGCGTDQPPRPGSNLCLNDSRIPPASLATAVPRREWALPRLADIAAAAAAATAPSASVSRDSATKAGHIP